VTPTKARLAIRSLPAPGRPGGSALALALGAVTNRSVRLLSGDSLVLRGRRVGDISLRDRSGLGLSDVDG